MIILNMFLKETIPEDLTQPLPLWNSETKQ